MIVDRREPSIRWPVVGLLQRLIASPSSSRESASVRTLDLAFVRALDGERGYDALCALSGVPPFLDVDDVVSRTGGLHRAR